MQTQTGEICTGTSDSRGSRLKSLVRSLNLHFRSTGYTSPNSALSLAHSCSFCPHHTPTGLGTPLSFAPALAQHSQLPASPSWGLWFSHQRGRRPAVLPDPSDWGKLRSPSQLRRVLLHRYWVYCLKLSLFLKKNILKEIPCIQEWVSETMC